MNNKRKMKKKVFCFVLGGEILFFNSLEDSSYYYQATALISSRENTFGKD
jgi:hypothetical protein